MSIEIMKENYRNLSAITNSKLFRIIKNYVFGIIITLLRCILKILKLNLKVNNTKDNKEQLSFLTIFKYVRANILNRL